uniref:Uncharacterized protein n=1 Tax=Rhizophagus irregularis (strain DAOM 181602 / DAOM 197198 / MUCL 43194) TaxID=747089 RepID=U9UG21_RHIID
MTRTLELCCWTNNTNQTLEFRLPDENYEPDFGIIRIIRTGLWNLGKKGGRELPDENYEPDFGI